MSRKLGRNDPCHCGSGRKYKQCHLREDEAAAARPGGEQAALALDIALDWLQARHRKAWGQAFEALIEARWPECENVIHPEELDSAFQWALIANLSEHLIARGELEVANQRVPIIDLLLSEGGPVLNDAQRAFIVDIGRVPLRLFRIVALIEDVGVEVIDVTEPDPAIDTGTQPAPALREPVPRLQLNEPGLAESVDVGMVLGARLISVQGEHALPGALYPFRGESETALRAAVAQTLEHCLNEGASPEQTWADVEATIVECWLDDSVVLPDEAPKNRRR